MVSVDPLVSGCGVAAPDGVHLYRGAALRVLKPVNQHQKTILSSALNDASLHLGNFRQKHVSERMY